MKTKLKQTVENGTLTILIAGILLMLFLMLAGCGTVPTTEAPKKVEETKPVSKEPKLPAVITKGWHSEYEAYIEYHVAKLPAHMKYNSKPKYWAKFYKSLSASESTFYPFDIYWEKTLNGGYNPTTGSKWLSEGLFQLSYSDAQAYGCKGMDWKKDKSKKDTDKSKTIFIPKVQFDCSFIIMENKLKKNGTPFFNNGHYWIVLKPAAKYYKYHKNFLYYYNKWVTKELRK